MLTERQEQILLAVITQFMQEGVAVGSESITSGFHIDVSSATIRNEMVQLTELGFLSKGHLSAGREPTDLGLRFFVKELMNEISMSDLDGVVARQSFFCERFDEESLIREILTYLSNESDYAAVSLLGDVLRYKGISKLMKYNELRNLEVIEGILDLLENKDRIVKIFSRSVAGDVRIAIGGETELGCLDKCAFIFSEFNYIGDKKGYISVLGPRRMDYSRVIPEVRFVRDVVEESILGW